MMKSQDIVVLLKLQSLMERSLYPDSADPNAPAPDEDPYSVRSLEASLGISKTEISASINRSLASGLAVKDRERGKPRPQRRSLYNFLIHGLRFAFPVKPGAMTRGLPTAFSAAMLKDRLVSAGQLIYVWPKSDGRDLGQAITPLFGSVPEAALRDKRLYEYLALADALRMGNQREIKLADDPLAEGLLKS